VRDGGLWTSGRATPRIDLALALVEEDYGAALVRRLARWMVVFLQAAARRLGERLFYPLPIESPLRALLDSIVAHPADDHSLAALSRRAAISQRHLTRLFEHQLGTTPGRLVERVRVEAACARLEESNTPLPPSRSNAASGAVETMQR